MNIDEKGEFSIGSDHNRIKLSFSRSSWRTIAKEHRNPAERHLPQSEYVAVAEAFEHNFQPTEPPTYDQFVLELRRIMKKQEIRVNSRGGLRRKGWWDEEVQGALSARRTANRLHRAAVRTSPGEECMSTWEEYLRLKREMQILVQSKRAQYNSRQLRDITEAGRNGANKFWKYVSSLDRQTPAPELRHHSSNLPVTDLAAHLMTHMQELFNPTHDESTSAVNGDTNDPHQPSEEDHWQITRITLERALPRISASTATGLDDIPAGLVKCLGKSAREHLAGIFNTILKNGPIPPDWQCGRVSLVCKRGGDAGLLGDYRPIMVTSVLYRLFAQVLKVWMSGWAEKRGIPSELQNGFRRKRRLEDNLFMLTQTIEVAGRESRGLLGCFLDVAKAYDSVPNEEFFHQLDQRQMPTVWTDFLRRLYAESSVVACFRVTRTPPVKVTRGLRQGCPLSPLLDMLYVAGLEQALLESGVGFAFRLMIVLLAERSSDLQRLVTLADDHLKSLGLHFDAKKLAILQFSGVETIDVQLPDGGSIPVSNQYRYLGVNLCTSADIYDKQEEHVRQASVRAANVLRRRSLWGCNRFVLVRELWKTVHVPVLTLANAVICLSAATRQWLERGQREVGRLTLACHGRVAVEAVQGDLGWSSYEAREARSKAAYEGRLRLMKDQRWARRVFRYTAIKGMNTPWPRRLQSVPQVLPFY
ncbi:uncharacterized protein LOC142802898 [Rhipicephalus microplus]|uniref:uncharacterized protein LOC142802898 n=1 Tax=Rhipicephalus microplus TaxID=6941 RepID=UPI003F6C0A7E